MHSQRRIFLLAGARLASLGAALGTAGSSVLAQPPRAQAYPFSLGVASGSPLPDSVILWTRILADPLNALSSPPIAFAVRWEVAHDQAFTRIAAKGTATASFNPACMAALRAFFSASVALGPRSASM